MSETIEFKTDDLLEIHPLYQFQWEESQQAYLLLYPEGVVKLNESGGEILKRCADGQSVGDMVADLKQQFQQSDIDIETSVNKFLEASHAKGWIRRKA